jgi:hypothetical protein
MHIKNVNQLVSGQVYWYITVPYCCHFNGIKILSAKFNKNSTKGFNENSLYGMILFEKEKDAKSFLKKLKNLVDKNIIDLGE